MNPFEFLGFERSENDKILGIVTIRAWGKVILNFRLIEMKDGNLFAATPTFKNGVDAEGKEKFDKVFMIDSAYEKKMLDDLIKKNIPGKDQIKANAPRPVPYQPANQNKPMPGMQIGNFSNSAAYMPPHSLPRDPQNHIGLPGEYLATDGKWYPMPPPIQAREEVPF